MTFRRVARFAVLTVIAGLIGCASDATDAQIQALVDSVVLQLGLSKLTVGQTVQAQAIARDVAGGALAGVKISWASSNTDVATVTTDGLVTAVSAGNTDITASAAGHSAKVAVEVVDGDGSGPVVPTQVVIAQQPTNAMNGTSITPPPVVELRDADNNRVAGADRIVTATVASGTGTITGSTTTSVNGVATFSDLRIAGTGTFTLTFSADNVTSATSQSFSVTDVQATQLSITTQPSASAQSGVALAQQPAVQALDASGNTVARSGIVVTAAISAGGGTLGGTATATTDASGTATFTDLSISGAAGSRTLTFTATGLTAATSNTIVVGAGAATQLSITTQPSSAAQSGVALAQQPAIQLRDASGNAVSQSGVQITASVATGGGTLGGTASAATNASGLATFTNLSITGAGTQTLQFASSGLASVVSSSIGISAGAPNQLTIATQPSATAQSGVAFAQQPAVQLRDASGNAISQSGVSVTASILSGGGTLGGTTSATTTPAVWRRSRICRSPARPDRER
jgi:adhesin/invasin